MAPLRVQGATAAQIAALPVQTVPAGGLKDEQHEPLKCAVCLEEFSEGCQLRRLPCTHRFHADCIAQWLTQKACCPVCQRECK